MAVAIKLTTATPEDIVVLVSAISVIRPDLVVPTQSWVYTINGGGYNVDITPDEVFDLIVA